MYRIRNGELEALLVHLGGPFWARKDAGAWFVPKGGVEERRAGTLPQRARSFRKKREWNPTSHSWSSEAFIHKSQKSVWWPE